MIDVGIVVGDGCRERMIGYVRTYLIDRLVDYEWRAEQSRPEQSRAEQNRANTITCLFLSTYALVMTGLVWTCRRWDIQTLGGK